jgi:hypothetical protein
MKQMTDTPTFQISPSPSARDVSARPVDGSMHWLGLALLGGGLGWLGLAAVVLHLAP